MTYPNHGSVSPVFIAHTHTQGGGCIIQGLSHCSIVGCTYYTLKA